MRALLWAMLALVPSVAQADPAVVAGSFKSASNANSVTSLSIAGVSAPSAADQILVVCVAARAGSPAPGATAVTWNSRALEKIGHSEHINTYSQTAEMWVLDAPDGGVTSNVTATVAPSARVLLSAFVVSGTSGIGDMAERPSTPTNYVSSTTLPLAAADADSLVVDCGAIGHGTTASPNQVGQTVVGNVNDNAHGLYASTRIGPGVMGWTNSGDSSGTRWGHVAAEFESAQAPGGGGTCPAGTVPGCVVPNGGMCAEVPEEFTPPDGGLVDVMLPPYNAACDGVTDDTAAIQAALRGGGITGFGVNRNLFLGGHCAVSGQIIARLSDGRWLSNIGIYGSGPTTSGLRLLPGSTGFQNPNDSRAVLHFASSQECPQNPVSCSEDPSWNATGSGNKAFHNRLYGVRISCGTNNPGCVAVNYLGSNIGTVQRAEFISEDGNAVAGIALTRFSNGPSLFRDLKIQGFKRCLDISQFEVSSAFEDIDCVGYTVEAVRNASHSVSFRRLRTMGGGPAFRNDNSDSYAAILESEFEGGAIGTDAVLNAGTMLIRDTEASGFSDVIGSSGAAVAEYVSHGPFSAFPSDARATLRLPIQETPRAFGSLDPTQRANCGAFGASGDDFLSDADGIGLAISTGRPIIYCVGRGAYRVSAQINIPASTRVVDFLGAAMLRVGQGDASPDCLINVAEDSPHPLHIRRVWIAGYTGRLVCVSSNRTVVLESVGLGLGEIHVAPGAGDVFLDDAGASLLQLAAGTRVWARQANMAISSAPVIANAGGKLWVLGLATEGRMTISETTAGGCTEITGGMLYPTQVVPPGRPAHIVANASASFSHSETDYYSDRRYPVMIRETRGSTTQDLLSAGLPLRGYGHVLTLGSAHASGCAL